MMALQARMAKLQSPAYRAKNDSFASIDASVIRWYL